MIILCECLYVYTYLCVSVFIPIGASWLGHVCKWELVLVKYRSNKQTNQSIFAVQEEPRKSTEGCSLLFAASLLTGFGKSWAKYCITLQLVLPSAITGSLEVLQTGSTVRKKKKKQVHFECGQTETTSNHLPSYVLNGPIQAFSMGSWPDGCVKSIKEQIDTFALICNTNYPKGTIKFTLT